MRRFWQIVTLLALLVAGSWLLGRPSELGRETPARQDALRRAANPGSVRPAQGDVAPSERAAAQVAEPALVDFGDVPEPGVAEPPSQYELWLHGEIDLDRETGRISEAELLERQEVTLARSAETDIPLVSAVTPLLPPAVETKFNSLSFSNSAYIPPDPDMAAGPNHLLVAVNVYIAIYNKSGGELFRASPYNLFGQDECKQLFLFDPNVLYDEEADRWIVAYAAGPQVSEGGYCMLASASGNPLGLWRSYFFQVNSSNGWLDFPHAGVGDSYIFMAGNQFDPQTNYFDQAVLYAFPKEQLYEGRPVNWTQRGLRGFSGSDNYFAPQPLKLHGAANGTWPALGNQHYFIIDDVRWNGWTSEYQLYYLLLRWNPATNSATAIRTLNFGTSGSPLDVPQLNGDPVEANDLRPLDFEYRNGYGWMAMTVGCNPGSGAVNCVRWAQVNLTTGGLGPAGTGLLASNGVHRFFPDLAVNHCDDMAIGFSKGSASTWPGIWYTGRRQADTVGQMRSELLLHAGEKAYSSFETLSEWKTARRWGDYTGMTPDPDGLGFWYVGEYSTAASTRANWGTYVGSFTLSPDLSCGEPTQGFLYLPAISR